MLHSLRIRILLAMVTIAVLGVAITAALASRSTEDMFRQYSDMRMGRARDPFVRILVNQYTLNHTWEGVQPLIENLGQSVDDRVILVDASGRVVADSDKTLVGTSLPEGMPPGFRIMSDRIMVGRLFIDPFKARRIADDAFLARINLSVFTGTGLVILAMLLSIFVFSRVIIRPVEQLTTAAQRMEKGDLSVRVNIRSRDEVGRLGHAFNAMAEGLSRLEQLRRNMVSDVAHELRTPLTNIRGYLEAVRDGLLSPDRNLADNLYEETMLLNRLVNDLQDLALAESGHLRLEKQPLEVEPLLQTVVDLSRPRAQEHKLELVMEIEPGLPEFSLDEQRMIQALRNLLNNAIDFTPPGGRVIISARSADPGLLIAVSDTGPGISPEQLGLVFERFYRADPSRARSTGGAGLGLAIVRQLVELHGGRVWAESELGKGSVFFIEIP